MDFDPSHLKPGDGEEHYRTSLEHVIRLYRLDPAYALWSAQQGESLSLGALQGLVADLKRAVNHTTTTPNTKPRRS